MTKDEIVNKYWVNPYTNGMDLRKRVDKMMDDWGIELFKFLEDHALDFSCEPPTKTSAKEFYEEVKKEMK